MTFANDPPEPGERLPAPTEGLHRLQDFVNTNDIEEERDEIGTPAKLGAWLTATGALREGESITADAHRRAIAVREGLRALGRANNGEPLDEEELAEVAALNEAAARLPLVAAIADHETWRLRPAQAGLDGFLADTLSSLIGAMADGSWSRMKACRNDTCRWLFYDSSRNRSGTWCSMAVCGSRLKARAYRARRRQAEHATA